MIRNVDEIYASKGTRLVHVHLKNARPSPAELTKILLGPTGNLRAPTLRVARTLLVGFDQQTYEQVFGVGG